MLSLQLNTARAATLRRNVEEKLLVEGRRVVLADDPDERERDARRKEEDALDVWAALSRGDKTEAKETRRPLARSLTRSLARVFAQLKEALN